MADEVPLEEELLLNSTFLFSLMIRYCDPNRIPADARRSMWGIGRTLLEHRERVASLAEKYELNGDYFEQVFALLQDKADDEDFRNAVEA